MTITTKFGVGDKVAYIDVEDVIIREGIIANVDVSVKEEGNKKVRYYMSDGDGGIIYDAIDEKHCFVNMEEMRKVFNLS